MANNEDILNQSETSSKQGKLATVCVWVKLYVWPSQFNLFCKLTWNCESFVRTSKQKQLQVGLENANKAQRAKEFEQEK